MDAKDKKNVELYLNKLHKLDPSAIINDKARGLFTDIQSLVGDEQDLDVFEESVYGDNNATMPLQKLLDILRITQPNLIADKKTLSPAAKKKLAAARTAATTLKKGKAARKTTAKNKAERAKNLEKTAKPVKADKPKKTTTKAKAEKVKPAKATKPKAEPKPKSVKAKAEKPQKAAKPIAVGTVKRIPIEITFIKRFLKECQVGDKHSAALALKAMQQAEIDGRFTESSKYAKEIVFMAKEYKRVADGTIKRPYVDEATIADLKATIAKAVQYPTVAFVKAYAAKVETEGSLTAKQITTLWNKAEAILEQAPKNAPLYNKVKELHIRLGRLAKGEKVQPSINIGLSGYKRKTADIWETQMWSQGYGWETVTQAFTKKEAYQDLKAYRENDNRNTYRIVKKRVKK